MSNEPTEQERARAVLEVLRRNERLQPALAALLDNLRTAQALHSIGAFGGRPGAMWAIRSVVGFLQCFDEVRGEFLANPLIQLNAALLDLHQKSIVHEMLRPEMQHANRPVDSRARQAIKASAAASVSALMQAGYSEVDACALTEERLREMGVKVGRRRGAAAGSGRTSDSSVRPGAAVMDWRKAVRRLGAYADSRGRESFAFRTYRLLSDELLAAVASRRLAGGEARNFILDKLVTMAVITAQRGAA